MTFATEAYFAPTKFFSFRLILALFLFLRYRFGWELTEMKFTFMNSDREVKDMSWAKELCVKTKLSMNATEVRPSVTPLLKTACLQLIFCYFTFHSAVDDIFTGQLKWHHFLKITYFTRLLSLLKINTADYVQMSKHNSKIHKIVHWSYKLKKFNQRN